MLCVVLVRQDVSQSLTETGKPLLMHLYCVGTILITDAIYTRAAKINLKIHTMGNVQGRQHSHTHTHKGLGLFFDLSKKCVLLFCCKQQARDNWLCKLIVCCWRVRRLIVGSDTAYSKQETAVAQHLVRTHTHTQFGKMVDKRYYTVDFFFLHETALLWPLSVKNCY